MYAKKNVSLNMSVEEFEKLNEVFKMLKSFEYDNDMDESMDELLEEYIIPARKSIAKVMAKALED